MKKVFQILFPCLLFISCHPRPVLPEATEAAYEIYTRFSEYNNLNVALVGDYNNDTCTINAVMLQARDSLGWLQLFEKFRLPKMFWLQNGDEAHSRRDVDRVCIGNMEDSRQFLMNEADTLVERLQKFRESGDSNLAPHHASSLLEEWTKEMKVGASLSIDYNHLTMWVFLYCDREQLHDIFCFLYHQVWTRCTENEDREPVIYTEIGWSDLEK